MYKVLGVIFCAVLVLFCSPNGDFLGSFDDISSAKVYFCTNFATNLEQVTTIKNGNGYIISTEKSTARAVQNSISSADLQGVAVRVDADFDCQAYLQKISARVISSENVGENQFLYAYSPRFSRFVTYNGQKINIQIAQNSHSTTIGYPLILTGA